MKFFINDFVSVFNNKLNKKIINFLYFLIVHYQNFIFKKIKNNKKKIIFIKKLEKNQNYKINYYYNYN